MKSIKDPVETRKFKGFRDGWLSSEVVCQGTKGKPEEEEDDTRQPQPEDPEEYWKKQSAIRAAMMGDYMAYAEEKNAETV